MERHKHNKREDCNCSVPFDPMAVTWADKYSDTLDTIWGKIPNVVGQFIVFLAVLTLGATMRGEWLLVAVHCAKYLGYNSDGVVRNVTLDSLYLRNLPYFWLSATAVSYGMYFIIGGFLHWYYYVRQRHRPHEWKCQPEKFLEPHLERHEILLGSLSLLFTSTSTAFIACYISNGGWSRVYYQFDEFSWLWWFLQWPVIFIYQDYITYLTHRLYHLPFLYKHFHKMHHKYKQPTAFSVTAIHPFEIMHVQLVLLLPIFVFPVHFVPFYVIALYTYYHGIIDHSGINFKAYWWQPWQPDAIFHDNHHQYFHVNFGFNCFIWDKLHGTYRRKDRIYTEDTYYGQGKTFDQATEAEISRDLNERRSENRLAYRNNKMEFKLTKSELNRTKLRTNR